MVRQGIIILILFFGLIGSPANSKSPPPGTGTADVPANILIMLDNSGSMSARVRSGSALYYPSDVQTGSPLGPFTITKTTDKVDTRARGRLLSLKIENDAAGETWRYGSFRMDAQPDGRR